MKLAIQIPAHNEQDSVLEVLKSIPKQIKGIDEIYVFVVDDGSDDSTSQIAFELSGRNENSLGYFTFRIWL